jgi:hypothetical protein
MAAKRRSSQIQKPIGPEVDAEEPALPGHPDRTDNDTRVCFW